MVRSGRITPFTHLTRPVLTTAVAVSLVASALVFGLSGPAGAVPALVSSKISPELVAAGTKVTMIWTLRTSAPIVSTSAQAVLPDGTGSLTHCGNPGADVSGTATSGTYRAVCTVPVSAPDGTYAVVVSATDAVGAQLNVPAGVFGVTGGSGTGHPTLVASSVSPNVVTAGSRVSFTWSLSTPAGIAGTAVQVNLPDGTGTMSGCGPVQQVTQATTVVFVTQGGSTSPPAPSTRIVPPSSPKPRAGTAGVYRATCDIPAQAPNGVYPVTVTARDTVGEQLSADAGGFRVTGGSTTGPPALGSASIEPAVTRAGSRLSLSWSLASPVGIAGTSAQVSLPGNAGSLSGCASPAILVAGTDRSGTYRTSCTIPSAAPAGDYTATVLARDAVGEQRSALVGSFTVTPEPISTSRVHAGASTASTASASGVAISTSPERTAGPLGVSATPGTAKVMLHWRPPAGGGPVTRYYIYRGLRHNGETGAAVATTGLTYTDPAARPGVTYYYVVEAMSANGISLASAEVSATPHSARPDPTSAAPQGLQLGIARSSAVSSQPTQLSASGVMGAIQLSWNAPASRSVSGYAVYRGTNTGLSDAVALQTTDTSFLDTGVVPGVTYYYVVSADTPAGVSLPSNEVSATALGVPSTPAAPTGPTGGGGPSSGAPAPAPVTGSPTTTTPAPPAPTPTLNPPTGLVATSGSAQVDLRWGPPVGGAPLTAYDVYRGTSSGAETHAVVATSATSYVDATAVSGATYYYVVEAVTADGVSPPSNEASATAGPPPSVGITPPSGGGSPQPAAPSAPHLTVTAGVARATLNWAPPQGGGPVTSYVVLRGTHPGGEFAPVATSTTSYVDLTVTPGVEYYYVVRARGPGGSSAPSNEVAVVPFGGH